MRREWIEEALVAGGILCLGGSGLMSLAVYTSHDPCGLQYIGLFFAVWPALAAVPLFLVAAVLAEERWRSSIAWGELGAAVLALFITVSGSGGPGISDDVGTVLAATVLLLTGAGVAVRAAALVAGSGARRCPPDG